MLIWLAGFVIGTKRWGGDGMTSLTKGLGYGLADALEISPARPSHLT